LLKLIGIVIILKHSSE